MLLNQVELEREATKAGETLTFDVTSTSSYKVIDVNTLIDLKVSVDSFELRILSVILTFDKILVINDSSYCGIFNTGPESVSNCFQATLPGADT